MVAGSFTASGETHDLELGFIPKKLRVTLADGSLMAGRENTVTVANIKGTFALTVADYDELFEGVSLGGLTDTETYHYTAER